MSAENGHEEVCKVLLDHRAFVNAKAKSGLTPLHLAAQVNFLIGDLAQLLRCIIFEISSNAISSDI